MLGEQASSSLVDHLAEEFIQRYRRGERPTVAEYLQSHPDLGDEIRDLFPALVMLEGLVQHHEGGAPYSLLSGIRRPDVLGDYRILQEVGRGGMGIVYEAEQISLGRHVALKILPFQLAGDEEAVERFQREARAAALLQHPNIVTVHDVRQEDSVWYYAMQFVHGQSIHEILEELRRVQRQKGGAEDDASQLADLALSLLSGRHAVSPSEVPVSSKAEGTARDRSSGPTGSKPLRAEEIRGVVDAFLQRRQRGEDVSEEALLEQHAGLLPELGDELRLLRLLEASRPPKIVDDLTALEARRNPVPATDVDTKTASVPCPSTSVLAAEQDGNNYGRKRKYYANVVRLVVQVARALEHAHSNGVIHRDVKPSNLMLDTQGHIWITDFGLAKLNRADMTSTGKLVGTLRYMAPEQIQGRCDRRTDVYSLGVTLYEMLTLRPAFQGANYLDTIRQICHEGPPPPRAVERTIPRDLETIVLKAIQRDPDERYPTARACADDLQRLLDGEPIRAKRSHAAERIWRYYRRHARVASLVAVLLALALSGWLAFALVWADLRTKTSEIERTREAVERLESRLRESVR